MKSPFRSPLNCISSCSNAGSCGVKTLVKIFGPSITVKECDLYLARRRDVQRKAVVG